MPFTADQIINKRIFTKANLKKLNSRLEEIGTIPPGPIGVVFTYVTRGGKVFWMIGESFARGAFLVQHNPAVISLDPQERREIERKEQAKKDKQQIEQKGAVPFYIEKYGRWLIVAGLAGLAITQIFKRQNT